MAMEHKAFAFDYTTFVTDLSDRLYHALEAEAPELLEEYIRANEADLKDPYSGDPLPPDWDALLEQRDVQEYGDIALTRFYDPTEDIGLSTTWQHLDDLLRQEFGGQPSPILGIPFGPTHNLFDPGRMGTYFQSPTLVRTNLDQLESLLKQKLSLSLQLGDAVEMLRQPIATGQGLFVTF